MKIHLIAIGGAVMHNMAMALHNKGYRITGSDDEIFEPSRSRLEKYGLLPESNGWDPDRISPDLDGVILGMHAKKDNPELVRARELGIKIWSFPEYIFEQCKDKKRIVIGGSHGKTTVTSMIMHVLWYNHFQFDYMVGSQLEGFETMVKLSPDAPVVILEGDEYLTSPIDRRPKFHWYQPHIAVLTGIAWDHMNVFPTFDKYLEQFRIFIDGIEKDGQLFWYDKDQYLNKLCASTSCNNSSYTAHPYEVNQGHTYLLNEDEKIQVPVFGKHNMQNISAALIVCRELGLSDDMFYEAISSFKGAARRQELLAETERKKVYLDFAHAPSKVTATVDSFRETFKEEGIFACLEIHTFSSLNKDFLPQYKGSLDQADRALVYYDPEVVKRKNLPPLSEAFVRECFKKENLEVCTDKSELEKTLKSGVNEKCILFMSSGNFGGVDLKALAAKL